MAIVENPPSLEQALAEEVLAQGIAKPYPFPFCLWSPLVHPSKSFKITTEFKNVIIDVYSSVVDRRMRRINLARCI